MNDETPEQVFERLGEAAVRLQLETGQYVPEWHGRMVQWLAKREESSRLRNEASQAEQYRTALIAKKAAIIAAIAATAVIPLAIIEIIIQVLAWLYPHH